MRKIRLYMGVFATAILIVGCGNRTASGNPADTTENEEMTDNPAVWEQEEQASGQGVQTAAQEEQASQDLDQAQDVQTTRDYIEVGSRIMELESGFSAVRFEGDDGLDRFLSQGGAESDREVMQFLAGNLLGSTEGLSFEGGAFGCSTISVENSEDGYYFGRNFDWNKCDALVVLSYPENGYASFSTVNLDFIRQGAGFASHFLGDETMALAALYAPLDGMNEKGLCVSVNMIQDGDTISQNTGKADITTTTAIRLLLDRAGSVEEALEMLAQYDLHASMDYMIHFAIADSTGRSVAVEYVDDVMQVIETPILTNFYLAEGDKNGIGTSQSHTRFEILEQTLDRAPSMDSAGVRDALSSVSKGNFGEFESTEWSVVFDQSALTAEYYHREDYDKSYAFRLFDE